MPENGSVEPARNRIRRAAAGEPMEKNQGNGDNGIKCKKNFPCLDSFVSLLPGKIARLYLEMFRVSAQQSFRR